MIRLAVALYFFVHLAVMIKAPQFKWLSRAVGYGLAGLFVYLVASAAEPNSNIVFIVCAILTTLGVLVAEILASIFKKGENSR